MPVADLVLDLPRAGKIATQNAAAERAGGELLAFSDANAYWEPGSLRRLVDRFGDPEVGYACGQVRFLDAEGTNQEGAYWRFEMMVRELESELAGVTAGNGAIYAVRREAYLPLGPSRSHDLSFPFALTKRGLALRLRAGGGRRGEARADPRGRVRAQAADDARPLGHRRARRDGLPARLSGALRLRDRLAPAAALRVAVPPRRSPSPPTSACSAAAGSTASRSPSSSASWSRPSRRTRRRRGSR